MSTQTYPISWYELTMYTGPYQPNNVVATIVAPLSNTVYRAIIRFYDLPYDQMPANVPYSTDYNVGFPVSAIGGILQTLEKVGVTFNFDTSDNHANLTYNGPK